MQDLAVPPAEITHQVARRAAILRILRESEIATQGELVERLHGLGVEATQSSVSRDIRELGVVKVGERYMPPAGGEGLTRNDFSDVAPFVRDIRRAGPNLTIVKTAVGAAQSVAVAVDKARWPEIVGTISGDDTIFIATTGGAEQKQIVARLRSIFRV